MKTEKNKCWMCKTFLNSSSESKGKKCLVIDDYVETRKDACERFSLAKFFYCHKRGSIISVEACISIRKKKRNKSEGSFLSAEHFKEVYSICHENCLEGKELERISDSNAIDLSKYKRRI